MVARVWTDPELLRTGLSLSLPLLFILLCHELGHYLTCRRYRLAATPPIFLPLPALLGTFGAFIRIRSPIRDRRQLFDVGAGGPLAGFAALLPFLVYGIARSSPAPLNLPAANEPTPYALLVPGRSLATEILTRIFHGPLPEQTTLDLHPFALAAWVGLLATALNLLPIGQLDGGHILYAVGGRLQRRLALPFWLVLAVAGVLYWGGWLLLCLLTLIFGLRHPPVRDESLALDRGRRAVALLTLLLLVLSFVPAPLTSVPVTH